MGNAFPGSDFVVAGKAFDALTVGGALLEVKTGYPSQYYGEKPEKVLNAWVKEAERDGNLAAACGYHFVFATADPLAVNELRNIFADNANVEIRGVDKDECVR
jgi:hypothetical protein